MRRLQARKEEGFVGRLLIYYDVNDPFWGMKLIEKVAENILSALKNPEEAIFKTLEETERQDS